MKQCISFLLLLMCSSSAVWGRGGALNVDSVLRILDREIGQRDIYMAEKERKMETLKEALRLSSDMKQHFIFCNQLFNEYKYYQYDSAYVYALRSLDAAQHIKDAVSIARAKCDLLHCYTSVGFFKEAMEVVNGFSTEGLSPDDLVEYYTMCVYFYQNLINFAMGTDRLLQKYVEKRKVCRELILENAALCEDSVTRNRTEDMLKADEFPPEKVVEMRQSLLDKYSLSMHEQAIQYCIMGEVSEARGDREAAIYYMALSAISDIRSNTRETSAAKALASHMYEKGDLDRAFRYIHLAEDDANFFNTRLRKIEINNLLPMIENQRYNWANRQRNFTLTIAVMTVVSLFLLAMMLRSLKRRNIKLQEARQETADAYKEIEQKAHELNEANAALSTVNRQLKEANEIKDQYIIQSLYSDSDFVNNVEEKCKLFERKLKAKQYADLPSILTSMNVKRERERMSSAFDQAFLKLFPNFIDEYNRLFPAEHHIGSNAAGALPTEVRIFALMRLGIEDTAQIARYLNLSLNTIYVYKSKVKAKALVPQEDFEACIMCIPKP